MNKIRVNFIPGFLVSNYNKCVMIEKIKNLSSNAVTLTLLLTLGIGVFLFLSNRSQNDELTGQSSDATATPVVGKTTITPVLVTRPAEPPKDDTPEPTWTPAIVLPDEPPATLPPPPPTPTSTPINPNESALISFDAPASVGAISPDGKMMAFNILRTKTESGVEPYNQVWLLDLNSKQTTKLVETGTVGADQTWSPDGQILAYQLFSPTGIEEIGLIGVNGKNDHSLLKGDKLLGYYWIDSSQLGLVRTDKIDQVDSIGKVKKSVMVSLPTAKVDLNNFQPKPKIAGHSTNIVVVLHDRKLLIVQQNGQIITISDDQGGHISDFALAPDGKQIVYLTPYETSEAVWVSDLTGKSRRKLFAVEGKYLSLLDWSPDSDTVVIGWSYTGTSVTGGEVLVWIDIATGQATPLGIDEVNAGFTFSPDGQSLYYGRTTFYQNLDPQQEKSTFYQLKVKK